MTGAVLAVSSSGIRAVDDSAVSPGVLGFVVVALLGVATYLLIRSMNRQIKRIDLPDDGTPDDGQPDDETDQGDLPPAGDGRAQPS